MIHQDPYSALNPARTIDRILGDPLALRARQRGERTGWVRRRRSELLELVGLDPGSVLPMYPHMLSGGMRQRVVIARALTVDPDLLVADEPVSMIDVSLRLGILRLLRDLRDRLGVSLLLITHDVATARYIGPGSDLYVLYRGKLVEQGRTETLIRRPVHPYTQCLISATPVLRGIEEPGPERVIPSGPPEEMLEPPGCLFEPRCPFAAAGCRSQQPPLGRLGATEQQHACLYPKRRSVAAVPAGPGRT
jgi:peptide/nickel transport system ATP-binding protein